MMYEWGITVEGSEDSVRDAAARLKSILDPESCSPLVSVGTGSGAITLKGVSDEPSEISQVAELLAEAVPEVTLWLSVNEVVDHGYTTRYQGHDSQLWESWCDSQYDDPSESVPPVPKKLVGWHRSWYFKDGKEYDPPLIEWEPDVKSEVLALLEELRDKLAEASGAERERLAALDELAKELYLRSQSAINDAEFQNRMGRLWEELRKGLSKSV
jgi:hypothetical protein